MILLCDNTSTLCNTTLIIINKLIEYDISPFNYKIEVQLYLPAMDHIQHKNNTHIYKERPIVLLS